MRRMPFTAVTVVLGMALVNPVTAENYSPHAGKNIPRQVLFGDTHLHSTLSADAGLFGNTITPEQAYRFAKGETIVSSTGVPAKLIAPLDFLVIADHAENLGLPQLIAERNERLMTTEFGRKIVAMSDSEDPQAAYRYWTTSMRGSDPMTGLEDLMGSVWREVGATADAFNAPGQFTALIGYEWTAGPMGDNLHRNVIFRDSGKTTSSVLPFSSYDSYDSEALWEWMANYEQATGGNVLAIPHNGNLSNGLMFDDKTYSGNPLDADYATRRARWEPLYEVTQIKGDSEVHPLLSPNDEFADYGTWDKGSFGPRPKTPDMLPREYAREALKRGLVYEETLGVNPFKFGMIGSTDSHTGLSTAEEDNFFGKASSVEPGAGEERFSTMVTGYHKNDEGIDISIRHMKSLASGLAAVWATENTREGIFDALERKEVYATTGSRISVRLFAGWDFTEEDRHQPDLARVGYERGVPMGADLTRHESEQRKPGLVIQASRDPNGANLDRIQVIKGWVDADGKQQERIVDVACGGDRAIEDGRCTPIEADTVKPDGVTYLNSVGAPFLSAFWRDTAFDPAQRAFYYVRVLEIKTPNWTRYDESHYSLKTPDNVPDLQQERAYTSPIWYRPEA
ncbi:MAG: DUF3604 domain-containing protein [Parahaliea sp.]